MNNKIGHWFYFASPQNFYPLAGRMWPWFAALATALGLAGLWLGMLVAPADFQQGEGYRIIFVHVPASWMSMVIYLAMAFWAVLGLTFNTRLSGMMGRALAPTGAMFAFLSLWTGALWGKPMWGAWWVWDARLTSELILFFLYLGYIALTSAIDDPRRADKAGGILALVGVKKKTKLLWKAFKTNMPAMAKTATPAKIHKNLWCLGFISANPCPLVRLLFHV